MRNTVVAAIATVADSVPLPHQIPSEEKGRDAGSNGAKTEKIRTRNRLARRASFRRISVRAIRDTGIHLGCSYDIPEIADAECVLCHDIYSKIFVPSL